MDAKLILNSKYSQHMRKNELYHWTRQTRIINIDEVFAYGIDHTVKETKRTSRKYFAWKLFNNEYQGKPSSQARSSEDRLFIACFV